MKTNFFLWLTLANCLGYNDIEHAFYNLKGGEPAQLGQHGQEKSTRNGNHTN